MAERIRYKRLTSKRSFKRRPDQLDYLLCTVQLASATLRSGLIDNESKLHSGGLLSRRALLRRLQHTARHKTVALAAQRDRGERTARSLAAHAAEARLSRAHRDRRLRPLAGHRTKHRRLQIHPSPSRFESQSATASPRLLLQAHKLR